MLRTQSARSLVSVTSSGSSQATSRMGRGQPRQAPRRALSSSGAALPWELSSLRAFADGGAQQLAAAHPAWRDFASELLSLVGAEQEEHMNTCQRCHSRRNSFGNPATAFYSFCRVGLEAIDDAVAQQVVGAKDLLLAEIAASMAIELDHLVMHDGVAAHRRDADFASLQACALERDRILAQARMREEFKPVLARLCAVQAGLSAWQKSAAFRLDGRRCVPHRRSSQLAGEEVTRVAERQVRALVVTAERLAVDWEKQWQPNCFEEVFSLFGARFYDINRDGHLAADEAPPACLGQPDAFLDDNLLSKEELARTRPMTVAVRVRPALAHEAGDENTASVLEDGATVSFKVGCTARGYQTGEDGHQTLQFDAALQGSQAELFSHSGVKDLVHKACEGHTSTVFAYGQTGAGKTFSLLGPRDCLLQLADDEVIGDPGIVPSQCRALVDGVRISKVLEQGLLPRAAQFLFKVLASSERAGAPRAVVKASALELYNERVYDLLSPSAGQLDVRQRPSPESGFYVIGLTQVECLEPEALMQVVQRGAALRHTNGHALSHESSRAHAIFTIEVERPGCSRTGKLIFADLAGSERIKSISTFGTCTQETGHINKSLLMLSNCVSSLASGSHCMATFRNSKLTKLLMESFCRGGYTLLIACVSPAQRHFDETANTLTFAAKCGNITWQLAAAAPKLSAQEREAKELRDTVEALREELTAAARQRPRRCECDALRRELAALAAAARADRAEAARLQASEAEAQARAARAEAEVAALRQELALVAVAGQGQRRRPPELREEVLPPPPRRARSARSVAEAICSIPSPSFAGGRARTPRRGPASGARAAPSPRGAPREVPAVQEVVVVPELEHSTELCWLGGGEEH